MNALLRRILPALALLFVSHGSALACAACYGDISGDKMSKAAAVGIGAMVIIMFVMLGTLFGFGLHFARRAKQTYPDYDELLSNNSDSDKPGDDSNPKQK